MLFRSLLLKFMQIYSIWKQNNNARWNHRLKFFSKHQAVYIVHVRMNAWLQPAQNSWLDCMR